MRQCPGIGSGAVTLIPRIQRYPTSVLSTPAHKDTSSPGLKDKNQQHITTQGLTHKQGCTHTQGDINAWSASELSLPNLSASHALFKKKINNRQYLLNDVQKATCLEAESCLWGRPEPQRPVLASGSSFLIWVWPWPLTFCFFQGVWPLKFRLGLPSKLSSWPVYVSLVTADYDHLVVYCDQ